MKKKPIITICLILSLSIVFISCDEEEFGENETLISHHSENESHNNGQNCMNCHTEGGSGDGWFTIAGSVFDPLNADPYPNATVKLYTEPKGSGTLIKTIEVDGKGNFYTTENVDFANGLYTSLTATNGNVIHMNSSISTGQCNSCHGDSTDMIWIE